ncbi:MAG: hypothetical protein A2X12_08340 [Bacteroidetes bacterium GWE2_29_8]|nr:MAG: hypothetical protein A2X12_08340 [Bacteroidetes bacterium GWE2_29_8]OFY19146.1 MAG: hypothetical protein A2X02_00450 [Bacteroidetes bacterium GWF2_29_10]
MQFKNIIGHQKIKKQLINTVNENRISHAQLFFGQEGSGELALAVAYAQYICCENKQEDDSCGVCNSCVKYEKLAHPDLQLVFPTPGGSNKTKTGIKGNKAKDNAGANYYTDFRDLFISNPYFNIDDWHDKLEIKNEQPIINKDDCKDIISNLNLKTYESEYRVVIIWMVDKLHYAAAPKILKTLEEPSEKTLFLLITNNYDDVLNTIISRTQMIKVLNHTSEELVSYITNKYTKSEQEAKKIVKLSNNNINKIIKLIENSEDTEELFESFRNWMRLCWKPNVPELVEWIDEIGKSWGREKFKSFFEYGLEIIRLCLLYNNKNNNLLNLDNEELDFISKFSAFINEHNNIALSEEFNNSYTYIERNASAKIVMLDLSLKVHSIIKK